MGIAKATKRIVFYKAMMALHGAGLLEENAVFDTELDKCAERCSRRRVAFSLGFDYDALLSNPIPPYDKKTRAFGLIRDGWSNLRTELEDICFNEGHYALRYADDVFYGYCQMAYRSPNYPFISYNGRYPNDSVHLTPDLQAAEEIRAIFRRYAAFMNGVIETAVLFRSILESAAGICDLRDRWPEMAVFSPSKTKPVPEDAAQKLRKRVDEEISECIASQY